MITIGVIPARQGSKEIKNKNLVSLGGKPLVQYTIEAAIEAVTIDYVVLTTDCSQILSLAQQYSVDYVRDRPAELASDTATTQDVVADVLAWLKNEFNIVVDVIVLLQPTSPFRVKMDIDTAVGMLTDEADSVISVNQVREHPYECVELAQNGQWKYLRQPKQKMTRRQEYNNCYYFINGAVYVVKSEYFCLNHNFISDKANFYIMDNDRSIDIDSLGDLEYARYLLSAKT